MEILARINDLILLNEPFCLATVLVSPRSCTGPGAKVIIRRDGFLEFPTGLADIDKHIAHGALCRFKQRKKLSAELAPGAACIF